MAGTHRGRPGSDALLTCDVCGKSAERTTCVPSLVGCEVIGAVLIEHEQPFGEAPERQVTEPLALVLFDLDRRSTTARTQPRRRGAGGVGDVAAHTVRGSDFVGRLGGEEFAVMLPGTDREGARRVAENLREAIGSLAVTGIERQITASFGVAVLPEDAPEAQALPRAADRTLYQAKANGRDRVELATV